MITDVLVPACMGNKNICRVWGVENFLVEILKELYSAFYKGKDNTPNHTDSLSKKAKTRNDILSGVLVWMTIVKGN